MRRHTLAIAILAALASSASLAETSDPQSLLIEQGYYWQSKKNPERALETWQKLLSLSPDQPDALYGIGLIQVQQNRPAEAQKYLARLQALSPVPRQALQLEQDITVNKPDNAKLLEQARELGEPDDEREKAVALYRQIFQGRQPQGLLPASTTTPWASPPRAPMKRSPACSACPVSGRTTRSSRCSWPSTWRVTRPPVPTVFARWPSWHRTTTWAVTPMKPGASR